MLGYTVCTLHIEMLSTVTRYINLELASYFYWCGLKIRNLKTNAKKPILSYLLVFVPAVVHFDPDADEEKDNKYYSNSSCYYR